MFLPNTSCLLYSRTGFDIGGRPTLGVGVNQACSVIDLNLSAERTTMRTDMSASHGAAREEQAVHGRVLFPPAATIKMGDVIEKHGRKFEITGLHLRYDATGHADHLDAQLRGWKPL